MSTIVLGKKQVLELLDMAEIIIAVEQAFRDWTDGKGDMPAKAYLPLEKGDFRAMPASLPGAAGIKWVSVYPGNPSLGLTTVTATIIYNDPLTGYPLAIMDATDLTAFRTGAAAAIASKYLARPDSKTLGIIGAGRQAYTQIEAHLKLFKFDLIRVYDRSPGNAGILTASFPKSNIKESTLEEAASSDIVCTLTPSREWFVKNEWIHPGTHINAVGADAEGKEELDPAILKSATVVVDDVRQASAAGEINVPITKGLFSRGDIHGNLGEIITARKTGRSDSKAITVFDSTGVAIEDIATAKIIYEKAKKAGAPAIDLMGVPLPKRMREA
jgi:alanine dehydrogenase